MKFRGKKKYGEYKISRCPFCDKIATQKNEQGLPVCKTHIKTKMQDRKCVCGKWLELRIGKYGNYFNCINCGNMSYDKGMARSSIAPITNKQEKINVKPKLKSSLYEKKEIVITSNDVEYFD